jgi:flagellar protein FliL
MATETTEAPSGGGKKVVPLAITGLVCLLVGGGAGAFALGPMLTRPAEPKLVHALTDAAHADTVFGDLAPAGSGFLEPEMPTGKNNEPRLMYTLDNLILNPARTNGTRFLMLSIAFEVRSAQVSDQLKARDAEVRDLVISLIGAKTVEEVSSVEGREAMKTELRDSVRAMLPRGSIGRVYLPQFVIQ